MELIDSFIARIVFVSNPLHLFRVVETLFGLTVLKLDYQIELDI